MHWLSWEPLCEPNFYVFSVLRVASGPRVKLASCKSALTSPLPPFSPPPPPPVVCSAGRSGAVVPVLVLLLVAWFILRGDFILSLCHFVIVFFSPLNITITSLVEEWTNLSVFRTFVRFVLVWICRFPLPLGVWEGLRFVIVAFPRLFPYLLFCNLWLKK